MTESVLWLVVGALTTVCSLALLFRAHARTDAAHNWPTADGTVLYAAIDHRRDSDGDALWGSTPINTFMRTHLRFGLVCAVGAREGQSDYFGPGTHLF